MGTRHSLATVSLEMEQQKPDAQSRQEQDRRTVNALMSEMPDVQDHLEEAAVTQAQEAEELQTQLRLLEYARDELQQEILEAQRKLRESHEGCELNVVVKQAERERISLKFANEDKEQKLALREEEQAAMGKEARELQTGLQEVQCSQLEARWELQELWRQMKMLDSENTRLCREQAELQSRLALGERAEKESRRETLGLLQRLLQGEASLEAMREKLQVPQWKLQEQEGEFQTREPGLLGSLEEARSTKKQQLDHTRGLELKVESARAQAAELGLRLSAADDRAQGLEAELARVEVQWHAVEA
ncbi:Rootletin [Plecturocebus cupreus]